MITPFLFGEPWLYHIIFLLIAIIPAYTLAITLYKNIDKWTGQIHNEYKVAAENSQPANLAEQNLTFEKIFVKLRSTK